MEYIEEDTPGSVASGNRTYDREHVAQCIEDIIEWKRPHLTAAELTLWLTFPARVRSHPNQIILMDANRPIKDYLMTNEIGPIAD